MNFCDMVSVLLALSHQQVFGIFVKLSLVCADVLTGSVFCFYATLCMSMYVSTQKCKVACDTAIYKYCTVACVFVFLTLLMACYSWGKFCFAACHGVLRRRIDYGSCQK